MNRLIAAISAYSFVFNYNGGQLMWAALNAALVVWCAIDAARERAT